VLLVAAFSFFVFEVSDSVAAAVLLQFFSSIALCYISGCFYPINSLPEVFVKLSEYLPTGIVRENFECAFSQSASFENLFKTFIYISLFLAASIFVRRVKIARKS
jgi:hypothetical protein